ncbi:MAG: hypothetical protein F4218_09475 [Synechococcus sp. SB0677_bin_5]|nr:hypothetical protein [Synechococcus sp. SB0677_bin_5]
MVAVLGAAALDHVLGDGAPVPVHQHYRGKGGPQHQCIGALPGTPRCPTWGEGFPKYHRGTNGTGVLVPLSTTGVRRIIPRRS